MEHGHRRVAQRGQAPIDEPCILVRKVSTPGVYVESVDRRADRECGVELLYILPAELADSIFTCTGVLPGLVVVHRVQDWLELREKPNHDRSG